MKLSYVFLVLVSLVCISYGHNCLSGLLVRNIDGSCNNLLVPSMGKSGDYFIAREGRDYYPNIYTPMIDPLPTYAEMHLLPDEGEDKNIRDITNLFVRDYDDSLDDQTNKTMFEVVFAQFIGHDLENNRFKNPEDAAFEGDFVTYVRDRQDVLCYRDGVYRCNDDDPVLVISGQRSDGVTLPNSTFRAINNATSYLDLNVVYGDNLDVSLQLRTREGGKLIAIPSRTFNVTMDDGDTIEYTLENFLPTHDDLPDVPLDRLFIMFGNTEYSVVSGEHRVNVNIGVGLLHTLFLREHNRVCDELMDRNILWKLFPSIFDEVIYQRARHIVIAKYQKIVYDQFLPALLGAEKYQRLGQYNGYNIFVNPTVSISFAAGAFRYGHYTMKDFPGLDRCGTSYKHGKPTDDEDYRPGSVGGLNPLPESLTHVGRVIEYGSYENIARGLIEGLTVPLNFTMHPILRDLHTARGGFDLSALDVMRSRYNSVPRYLKLRRTYYVSNDPLEVNIYGNPDCPSYLETDPDTEDPLECFLYINSNVATATKLKTVYKKVYRIDGIVGMMLEEYGPETTIGETASGVIIDQFVRVRDGDRFFYQELIDSNYFNSWEKNEILGTTMGKLLRRNFDGDEISFPDNPFIRPDGYRQSLKDSCE